MHPSNIHNKSFKRLYPKQCYYYTQVATNKYVENSSLEDAASENPTQISPSLNPLFVTGFTDAEGSFMISFTKTSESRHGFRIRAIFQIELELHKKDMELFNNIQAFFQGIGFRISTKNNCMALNVL